MSITKKWVAPFLTLFSYNSFCYSQISIAENINLSGSGSFGYLSESVGVVRDTDVLEIQEIILQLGFETGAITTDIFFDFEDNSLQVDAAVVSYQIGE